MRGRKSKSPRAAASATALTYPAECHFDSASVGWPGLQVHCYNDGGAGEVRDFSLPQHQLCVMSSTNPSGVTERRAWDGLAREGVFQPGGVAMMNAGSSFHWRWEASEPAVVLSVARGLLVLAADDAKRANADRVDLRSSLRTDAPAVARIAREMRREVTSPGVSRLYVQALGMQLAVRLLRDHSDARPPAPKRERPLAAASLRRAVDHLRERLAENVTLDDLAKIAGCGRFQLARRFKQATGSAPHQYQLRLRLECARERLAAAREGHTSVAEIAADCGFFDQSHFARHFRRAYGVPPSHFMNRRQ
jgi:AraC family transcriptional regulator